MRKVCVVPVLSLLLLAPAGALGQSSGGGNPFGPLPQNQPPPPEPPEPQPADDSGDEDGLGGTAFWMIIGTTGLLFAGIAVFITRDMRKTAGTRRKIRRTRGTGRPAADAADAMAGAARHTPGSQRAKAKAQQRAKTKAARKQRRKSRSR